MKRLVPWCDHAGMGCLLLAYCICGLIGSRLIHPPIAQGEQRSDTTPSSVDQSKAPDSKVPAKPHKEGVPTESSVQESKPAHPNPQASKSDESKTKRESGEEGGTEKGREGTGKRGVSSLILTVKLALLGDPRLFPYEIDVEAGSDEVTLEGKVSTEAEKVAASEIAGMVSTVKSVTNKLEVVKELAEVIAHKQDDIITRQVKERFGKSTTVTAANFDVKTEQGVVSLSGAVRFQVIVLEAVEAAKQVPGVRAVRTEKVRIESEG